MKNETLRNQLVLKGEKAFVGLMTQLDHLFDVTSIYLDRNQLDTPSVVYKTKELDQTVGNLASLTIQLAEVVKTWKHAEPPLLTSMGTELTILNEIYSNIAALIYFLTSHDIDLEPFDRNATLFAYADLVRTNRAL